LTRIKERGLEKVDSGFDCAASFSGLGPRSMDLVGRPAAQGQVGLIGVVVADPMPDPSSCLTASLEGIEKDAFVF
jgi:hypothetical protein